MLSDSSAIPLRYTQNFLRRPALVQELVTLAQIQPGDTVLEIGPGRGIITQELAQAVTPQGRVVALELDTALAQTLQEQFSSFPHIEIREQDALTFDLASLTANYTVVANVPFAITNALLEWLFQPTTGPQRAGLILQTETLIDARQTPQPFSTFKARLIEPLYEIQAAHHLSPADFSPPPAVDTTYFTFTKRLPAQFEPQTYRLYTNWLAYISHDRVGEGAWRKLFTATQLKQVAANSPLTLGLGLKRQTFPGLLAAFQAAQALHPNLADRVGGALKQLRQEQARNAEHQLQAPSPARKNSQRRPHGRLANKR